VVSYVLESEKNHALFCLVWLVMGESSWFSTSLWFVVEGGKEGWERLFCCVWYAEVVVGGVGPYRVVKCG